MFLRVDYCYDEKVFFFLPVKNKQLSITQALKVGWKTTTTHYKVFFWVVTAITLLTIVPEQLKVNSPYTSFWLRRAIDVVFGLVTVIVQMGLIVVTLQMIRGKKVHIKSLFSTHKPLVRYIVGSILYGLLVFGGLLLLVIPGIINLLRGQFFEYYVVDKHYGPVKALQASARLTQGVRLQLLWLNMLFMATFVPLFLLISTQFFLSQTTIGKVSFGAVVPFVAYAFNFIILPLTVSTYAYVYTWLLRQTKEEKLLAHL